MSVEQIEQMILELSPEERAKLDAWYAEQRELQWDRQIEEDVAAGRLDWLAEEAKADNRAGRCEDL